MKLRARAPNVADQSIIDSVVKGINLGPCGEYISRRKPKTVTKLFEIMQEYCISDRAKRRRLEEKNEQKKSRSSERSHSKPWHADEPRQKRTVNNISEEGPERTDTVTRAKAKGTDTKKDPTAMIVTIAKTDKAKDEGTAVVEGRKFRSVSSTARTKATGQTSALSQLKGKRSLIGRIPSQQNQSIIPRRYRLSLRQRQILGLLHQIGRCRTRFSIITHSHMHHLRNNHFQCYHHHHSIQSVMVQKLNTAFLRHNKFTSTTKTRAGADPRASNRHTFGQQGQHHQCHLRRIQRTSS